MTDLDLTELFERAGERTHVGPAPVEDMVAGASRKRRRRAMMLAAGAVAVVATAASATGLSALGSSSPEQPAASPSPPQSTPGEATAGTDLEGTWTVRALVGANGRTVLPKPYNDIVRLTFTDGEMTGTWGCTTVSGTYELGGKDGQDLRFPPEQMSSTSRDCIDARLPLASRLLDVRHATGATGVRYLHAENWMIVAELRQIGDVSGDALTLPCPASEQRETDLDIRGPGRPTPKRAVVPFAGGQKTVAVEQQGTARVHVIGPDGNVSRTYRVTQRNDGWRPVGYTSCAAPDPASSPSGWHSIEYGHIAFDVPADWAINPAAPCIGEAIVSPPRGRTSCPSQPSAVIIKSTDIAQWGASTDQAAVGDFVVRLTGVDAKTAQAILASVRTR